jgi:hypothetical protein
VNALDYIMEAQQRGLYDNPPKIKGKCRHCGKIIGRGVWAHEKACKAAKAK